jgi:hypothetical protein
MNSMQRRTWLMALKPCFPAAKAAKCSAPRVADVAPVIKRVPPGCPRGSSLEQNGESVVSFVDGYNDMYRLGGAKKALSDS